MKQPGSARTLQPSSSLFAVLLLLGVILTGPSIQPQGARAEEAQAPAAQKPEIYSAGYDLTWDKLLATLKSFDLSVATADKEGGKVTTVPHRYFKISSARFPPVQEDYRDTYEIRVEKRADKSTQVQITRKFELYDRTRPPNGEWMVQPEVKEKTGTSVPDILSALALEIAAAALPATR